MTKYQGSSDLNNIDLFSHSVLESEKAKTKMLAYLVSAEGFLPGQVQERGRRREGREYERELMPGF